ncbi:MAG: twin-arginine translocation signal domain-containing protein, partial [Burkholderiales bacterium]|nr:twin-arginine translocation signal domain-containing protein [Burkholderiales bacterium]
MLLTRKTDPSTSAADTRLARSRRAAPTFDRRSFLKRSGIAAGVGAFASQLPYVTMEAASAADAQANVKREVHRTVCTHCSVGCAIDAVVENGVWTRQEPVFDSPLNLGAHCAKGASIRDHGSGEHRLKSPMKLVDGRWQRIPWDQAINEVGDKLLAIR